MIDKLSEGMTVVQSLEVKTISGLDWLCGAEDTAFPEYHLMEMVNTSFDSMPAFPSS